MRAAPGPGFASALAAVTLIAPLAIHLYLPVVPSIKTAFQLSDAVAEGTFSITLATMAVATLVWGALSDRHGRKRMLMWGLLLFLVGSAMSAAASSVATLILGRLVQAAGAGCAVTLTRAMARDAYGPDGLVKAIAYLTMAYTLGPMIAPPVGGLVVDHLGWRGVFGFAAAAGGAITAAASFLLHETRWPLADGTRPAGMLRDFATLFADARFTAFVLQSGLASGTFFAIAAASPFLVEHELGRSATEYGLYFILFPAGYCAGNMISSRLSGRVAIEWMVLAGSAINLLAIAVLAAVVLGGELTPLVIFLPGAFVTFAQGLALPNAQAGAIQVIPGLVGTAAGIGVFCQTLGSALGAQAYGILADGTAVPMIEAASCAAVLTLIAGVVPLTRWGRAAERG